MRLVLPSLSRDRRPWLAGRVDATLTRLVRLPQADSTSTVLRTAVAAAPEEWPHLSAVVADHQTAGRGRTGRSWHTPAGAALTASVLLRPQVPLERLSWLTLLTGLAAVEALRGLGPQQADRIGLKWPNDVVVDGATTDIDGWGRHRKLGGILAEVVPAPASGGRTGRTGHAAVVVGIGINIRQQVTELPVRWATSLRAAGIAPDTDALTLLTAVVGHLDLLLTSWEDADGDARRSGLREAVAGACVTLGRPVRVTGPGGSVIDGRAEDIDDAGRLLVRNEAGHRTAVVAGDIGHVREA